MTREQIAVPPPYRLLNVGNAVLVALPDAVEAASRALRDGGSLLGFAAHQQDAEVLESRRGQAYAASFGGERWVIRHYRRGGALTRWLSDLYLRVGEPRPVHEVRVSQAARERDVNTPEVRAAAIYPAGAFYRGDLATRHVPRSANLAQILFGAEGRDPAVRGDALHAAGLLIRTLHERGIVHVDLTLQNLLLEQTPHHLRAYVLDLDNCRVAAGPLPSWRRRAMLRRFQRSLRGWEQRGGRRLDNEEEECLRAGYEAWSEEGQVRLDP